MEKYICVNCHSENVEILDEELDVTIPFGEETEVDSFYIHCKNCNFEFYPREAEAIYEDKVKALSEDSVPALIDSIVGKTEYKLASIERSLDLPERTLTKWKNRNQVPTAAGIALLRALNAFPYIISAAAYRYTEPAIDAFYFNCQVEAQSSVKIELRKQNDIFTASKESTFNASFTFSGGKV